MCSSDLPVGSEPNSLHSGVGSLSRPIRYADKLLSITSRLTPVFFYDLKSRARVSL